MSIPKRSFVFLRHGETAYNLEGRFQGHTDVPLNDTGHSQAARASNLLRTQPVTRIVASPAQRVLQTVRPFADAAEIPVEIDDDLMEYFVGSFEGRHITDILKEHNLQQGESWLSILPDDAECWDSFESRVHLAVARWTERYADETILIASHGLVFRALAGVLAGQSMSSGNAETHHFQRSIDGWQVLPVTD